MAANREQGDPKRDRGSTVLLLLSLLLSFTIWFIHNLSQEYSDLVTVDVRAVSNIEGRAARSAEEVSVTARCRASGFGHIGRSLRRKTVELHLDKSELQYRGEDYYAVDAQVLSRYASELFGSRFVPESFLSPSILFRFPAENCKKVPVQAVKILGFRPQYMETAPMSLTPDSVLVYGNPRLLDGVERILTRQISLSDIHGSVHGIVALDNPGGVRLSETEVTYSMDVTRFVEIRSRVSVGTRNVPAGRRLSVLPSSADVLLRCIFPVASDPTDKLDLYVDYSDFMRSGTGRCIVRSDRLPAGVIGISVDPEVVECVETL